MTSEQLQEQFEKETDLHWLNEEGEPDLDYVIWLEVNLINELERNKK